MTRVSARGERRERRPEAALLIIGLAGPSDQPDTRLRVRTGTHGYPRVPTGTVPKGALSAIFQNHISTPGPAPPRQTRTHTLGEKLPAPKRWNSFPPRTLCCEGVHEKLRGLRFRFGVCVRGEARIVYFQLFWGNVHEGPCTDDEDAFRTMTTFPCPAPLYRLFLN